jgi:hypothetical protein
MLSVPYTTSAISTSWKRRLTKKFYRVYCICRKPYEGLFMIQCEACLEWFHGGCIGLTYTQSQSIQIYICSFCVKDNTLFSVLSTCRQEFQDLSVLARTCQRWRILVKEYLSVSPKTQYYNRWYKQNFD